jgi:hypothetical protein
MFRRVLSLGLIGAVAAAACTDTNGSPHVSVVTDLTLPKGVLDRVTKLTLTVLEGNVTCDATIGQIALPGGADAAKQLAQSDLLTTGCAAGIKFCGDIKVDQSDAMRVFSAVAKASDDSTIAIGCTQATINQDAEPLAIKMFRYLAPADCTDMVLQPTEQCFPGGTATCDAQCQSNELLLSIGSTQNGTDTGVAGDKTDPFLLWPQASGTPGGRFFAFYTDRNVPNSPSNFDIALRAMTDALEPIAGAESPALAAGSIFLPNGTTFPPTAAPRQQSVPSAAFLKTKYYVAFQDDTGVAATGQDIHLRSMDSALVADQGATPLGINGGPAGTGGTSGSGEAGIQGFPSLAAGPSDRLFIAWEDSGQGKIAGRTLSPPSTLGNQNDISTGNANKGVSVAATSTGWVAVWQSGTSIKLKTVNSDGTPQGSEQVVNDTGSVTERPRVAALADGRFAVTWNAGGDIFVQRYDTNGARIDGDQASAINDVVKDGNQTTPAIGATTASGGSYVVAWIETVSGHVHARNLGGSAGFLFNNVNGQSSEYQASRIEMRTRGNPAVVAGGAGPYVAIAWEDQSATNAGIVARRFPLPSE